MMLQFDRHVAPATQLHQTTQKKLRARQRIYGKNLAKITLGFYTF